MWDIKNAGLLDFVAAWYIKAARYMALCSSDALVAIDEVRDEGVAPTMRAAFVSTNSITQGEQVGVLWSWMLAQGIKIHFAHRTFSWSNEARGKAAVHCVIVGFGLQDIVDKTIYEYEDIKGEPHAVRANNINPYLVAAPDVILGAKTNPIWNVPAMVYGNKPVDGGNLLLSDEDKMDLLAKEPLVEKWIRPLLGAEEFINNKPRWCLWLVDIAPNELKALPETLKRIKAVKEMRLASTKLPTVKLANSPTLFGELRAVAETENYILIPSVSSERRHYVPLGFFTGHTITTNANFMLPEAALYHFGVLNSTMHNAWMRSVCGRLKSDYRYSNTIVYNNFPWPEGRSGLQPRTANVENETFAAASRSYQTIEAAAQAVLDARAKHPDASLADLYDPLTMPANLLKAHQALDKAVDAAYGYKGANTDAARVAFLFELYQKITSLLPAEKAKPKRARR